MSTALDKERYTSRNPCPICGGYEKLARGQSRRCTGYLDSTGEYARCSREEHAGTLTRNTDDTYSHHLIDDCDCGKVHGPRRDPKVVKTTEYLIPDIDGKLIATHIRKDYDNGSKGFSWKNPEGGYTLKGVSPSDLLYNLHLLKERPDAPVCLVEGEKSADAANSAQDKVLFLGTVNGAPSIPSREVLSHLEGRQAWVWADNDDEGRRQMTGAVGRMHGVKSLRTVVWEDAPVKGDVADYLKDHSAEDLLGILRSAPMAPPSVILGPRFHWDRGVGTYIDGAAVLIFDQLRFETRSGDTTAEVQAIIKEGSQEVTVGRNRLNLLGPRSKADLAKTLGGRSNEIEWGSMLERACQLVIEAMRRGEPPVRLRDVAPSEPRETILVPGIGGGALVLDGDPVIFFGDGGSGKSHLALALGMSLQTRLGFVAGIIPARKMRVLYADWEWKPSDHSRRMIDLQAGMGGDHECDMLYLRCSQEGPLTGQVDRLLNVVREEQITHIVIDSVALACDGPPEDAAVAIRFFQSLGRLNIGSILIAHVNRSGDTSRPFGSAYWHNSARSTWYVKGSEEEETEGSGPTDGMSIGLFNRKHSGGPRGRSFGLRFHMTPGRTVIQEEQIDARPEMASSLPTWQQMAYTLRQGATTYQDLAEELNVPKGTLRKTVHDHPDLFVVDGGLVSVTGNGRNGPRNGEGNGPSDDPRVTLRSPLYPPRNVTPSGEGDLPLNTTADVTGDFGTREGENPPSNPPSHEELFPYSQPPVTGSEDEFAVGPETDL